MSSNTGRKPHGSGLGGGKSAKEMQAEFRRRMDAQPCVTRCVCGWSYEGTAAEGRELAKDHRRDEHPNITVTRRRRGSLQRFGSQDSFRDEGLANAAEVARMIQHGEERAA